MTLTAAPSYPSLTTRSRSFDRLPMPSECTVAQAAEFLYVSEGYVKELLEDELVLFRQENGEQMIEWNSLQNYEQDCRRMQAGVAEIIRLDQEMGLYDD